MSYDICPWKRVLFCRHLCALVLLLLPGYLTATQPATLVTTALDSGSKQLLVGVPLSLRQTLWGLNLHGTVYMMDTNNSESFTYKDLASTVPIIDESGPTFGASVALGRSQNGD